MTHTHTHTHTYLFEVVVVHGVGGEAETLQECTVPTCHQLVEDMEVALPWCLEDHTRLLQEVAVDAAAHRGTLRTRGTIRSRPFHHTI